MTKKECFEYFEFDDSYWIDDPYGEMTKEDWREIKSCCLNDIFNSLYKDYEYCGYSINNYETFSKYINHIELKGLIPYEEFMDEVYIPEFNKDCMGEKEYKHMVMVESHYW